VALQLPLAEWHRLAAETLAASSGGRLLLSEAEREGSDLWAIARTAAVVAEAITHRAVMALSRLAVDSAAGEWLDRLVFDMFGGLQRQSAQPARGEVQIRMQSVSTDAVTVPAETALLSGGIRYVTLAPLTIPAGDTADHAVSVQSDTAGAGRNAAAGSVWAFEAPPDSRLRATNPAAVAGSADAETDEALRDRARQYWPAQQRGTKAALELGALSVAGVRQAVAEERADGAGAIVPGYVTVYVADDAGESSGTITAAVAAELENWRAAGVSVTVVGGTPEMVAFVLALTVVAGFDTSVIRARVTEAIYRVGQRLGPGEPLYLADVWAALRAIPGLSLPQSTILLPPGDVVPSAPDRVLRVSSVTFS